MEARKKAEDEQTEKHKEVKKHQKELHKLEKSAAEKVSDFEQIRELTWNGVFRNLICNFFDKPFCK